MAWRAGILAACLALPTGVLGPDTDKGQPLSTHKRQIIDASGKIRPPEDASTARQMSAASRADRNDVDLPITTLAFDQTHISELQTSARTEFWLPDYGQVELTLLSIVQADGTTRSRFSHQGLVGTLTQRGPRFYLTVPTHADSYRIQGDAHQTHYVAHSVIAYRTIAQSRDYHYVQTH